jgi:hypothetical protein
MLEQQAEAKQAAVSAAEPPEALVARLVQVELEVVAQEVLMVRVVQVARLVLVDRKLMVELLAAR